MHRRVAALYELNCYAHRVRDATHLVEGIGNARRNGGLTGLAWGHPAGKQHREVARVRWDARLQRGQFGGGRRRLPGGRVAEPYSLSAAGKKTRPCSKSEISVSPRAR